MDSFINGRDAASQTWQNWQKSQNFLFLASVKNCSKPFTESPNSFISFYLPSIRLHKLKISQIYRRVFCAREHQSSQNFINLFWPPKIFWGARGLNLPHQKTIIFLHVKKTIVLPQYAQLHHHSHTAVVLCWNMSNTQRKRMYPTHRSMGNLKKLKYGEFCLLLPQFIATQKLPMYLLVCCI